MPFEMDSTISIHAPREGGDDNKTQHYPVMPLFQSTPPARGATGSNSWPSSKATFQSTPPARGATSSCT